MFKVALSALRKNKAVQGMQLSIQRTIILLVNQERHKPMRKNPSGGDPIKVNNSNFVAFAPANNPEIAVAVVVPSAFVPSAPNTITKELARSALDTLFLI